VAPAYETPSGPSSAPVEPPFSVSGFDTDLPIVAVSIHSGHALRPEVEAAIALPEAERLREEDPYLDALVRITEARVAVHVSRFEVDLNRPPATAVYRTPAEAWGLSVWKAPLRSEVVERSLLVHRRFYQKMERVLGAFARRFGRFVVLDLHSYNHRRGGPEAAPTDPAAAPEINLGTGTMDRARWAPVVDAFSRDLCRTSGKDVRENVCFRGGYFPAWVHRTFPASGCALAIELKKTFMDEWTGALDRRSLDRVEGALAETLPGLVSALSRVP
jgi:N-formylglutamate amidohydrolase